MTFVIFCISIIASFIGAVCGIGGGVIIKPVLDAFGWMSVASASFLSGCTVLSMTAYSVLQEKRSADNKLLTRQLIPVSFGAAAGGLIGKTLFRCITDGHSNAIVGTIQAICLILLTAGTIVYTCLEKRIRTFHIENKMVNIVVGLFLGAVSAFLGIGGGPFNLVALSFFFSLREKEAVISSLFIILIAQTSSILLQAVTGTIPDISWIYLIVMICGGITGGILARNMCCYMNIKIRKTLFLALNMLIILICCWNISEYL